ncbi:MAG: DUF3800 domain-containing protein [Candidatus Levybacteria bacterium]|nr:DUF3800 domain-containing protein [Candidatus Levybacteria bacterium]
MNSNLVYGFLDESPALSDDVLFFCVDIVSTSDKTNKQLQNIIKRARKRVVKKKLKSLSEIKFHDSDERTRIYVLKEIAKYNVKIIAVIIDKQGRVVKDTPLNYGIAVGTTIAEMLSVYPVLNLTLDKKFTKGEQEVEFLKYAQETVEKLAPKNKSVVFNPPKDSKQDSLLQLTDFVAGAIQAKYNNKDNHYVEIIQDKIVVEKMIKWTKLKKRIVNP